MKIGKIIHFEPWGDEPLIRLNRRQTVILIEEIFTFIVLPILLFFVFPWLGRCAEKLFR